MCHPCVQRVHNMTFCAQSASLFFHLTRNIRDIWCSGSANRLQQCDLCWCCWSKALHAGQCAKPRPSCLKLHCINSCNVVRHAASWFSRLRFSSVLQMCTECQKVGIHVYLSNCNGRATLEVFSAISVLNGTIFLTLLRGSCTQQTLISAFYLLRERPEDPHVKRFNELHEPAAYFRHRSWCRDVYSAAEGKLEEWQRWPTVWAHSFSAMYTNDPPVICCRRNLRRTPPPFGYEAAMSHALVILDACRGSKYQRRNYIVF